MDGALQFPTSLKYNIFPDKIPNLQHFRNYRFYKKM